MSIAWNLLKMPQFSQLPKITQDDIIYILVMKMLGIRLLGILEKKQIMNHTKKL